MATKKNDTGGRFVAWRVYGLIAVLVVGFATWISIGLSQRDNVKGSSPPSPTPAATLEFGLSRAPISRHVLINLCVGDKEAAARDYPTECPSDPVEPAATLSPRPQVLAASLESDLHGQRTSHQFPGDQLTVTAENFGRQGLLVTINANPQVPSLVRDDLYKGTVRVEREQFRPKTFELLANLEPRSGYPTAAVLLSLVAGAVLGGFVKWLNEFVSPLAGQYRRWRGIERRLRSYRASIPRDAVEQLDDVNNAIRAGDAGDISKSLDELIQDRGALIEFARHIRGLRRQIAGQKLVRRRLGSKAGLSPVRFFDSALAVENELIKDLRERTWPWPDSQKTLEECRCAKEKVRSLTSQIQEARGTLTQERRARLESFLSQVADGGPSWLTSGKAFDPNVVPGAVTSSASEQPMVAEGTFEDSESDAEEATETEPTKKPQETSEDDDEDAGLDPEERRAIRLVSLLNRSSTLTSLLTGGVVVGFGFLTQFADNLDFQGGRGDYLKLIGWAFAAQVTGVTVLEVAGRLKAGPAGPVTS